jgi:hypothetical protein
MSEAQNQPTTVGSIGAETFGAWAELNQRVTRDLARNCASTMEESARAAADVQQTMLVAWRSSQEAALRWQALWPQAFRDPLGWYERAVEHGISVVNEAIDLGRRNAETALHSFDRLRDQSADAARTLDETVKEGTSRIRDIQSRAAQTLRAA